jgi:hypothetical protein
MSEFLSPRQTARRPVAPPHPNLLLEDAQETLAAEDPDVGQAAAALESLYQEMRQYLALKEDEDERLEAALPFGAPRTTYQGEATLHTHRTLLEEVEQLGQCVRQAPAAERTEAWWQQIRERFNALAARLIACETSVAAPRGE